MGVRLRPAIQYIRDNINDRPLVGAEIGVQKGDHAMSILYHLNMGKLYLIDIWKVYEQCGRYVDKSLDYINTIKKFEGNDKVEIIKGASVGVSQMFNDNSLDFIYIDANHQYCAVGADIDNWTHKVKIGGVVSGHDYNVKLFGVTEAVDDYVGCNKIDLQTGHGMVDDWWFVRKV